jgi:hypothetical protein
MIRGNDAAGQKPGFFGPGEAGLNSLVKGSKCPTEEIGAIQRVFDCVSVDTGEIRDSFSHLEQTKPITTGGTLARLYHREWSGEWRLSCELETPAGTPPEQAGDRITKTLSARGARSMGEACEFVTQEHGGFTTFLTLTLDKLARCRVSGRVAQGDKKITYLPTPSRTAQVAHVMAPQFQKHENRKILRASEGNYCPVTYCIPYVNGEQPVGPFCRVSFPWESSIQKEASRFFDALNKMHRRGWVPLYSRGAKVTRGDGGEYTPIHWNTEGVKLGGPDVGPVDRLFYLWVAENPESDEGRNPHIHVLIKWAVPWQFFPAWAKRIETIWGQGFAHLEKLKAKEAAGYYIAKAAGYLTKGAGESDQGPVRGNRYGIAECARAPGWKPVLVWAWSVLGYLIKDAREKYNQVANPIKARRNSAAAQLKELPKKHPSRGKVAALLQGSRRSLKELPVFGRFHAIFKSSKSVDKFLTWAEARGWQREERPPRMWLSKWVQQRRARKERAAYVARFTDEAEGSAWWKFWRQWEPVANDNDYMADWAEYAEAGS